MTRANRTTRLLKVIDLTEPPGRPAASPATVNREPFGEAERSDGDLVSLRSHDLGAALARILDCAELIDGGDLSDDHRHLYAGILLREGRRLKSLVNNALALQRLETNHQDLHIAPVDLRSLITRAVLAAGDDDKRPITMHLPERLSLVAADSEAILAVLATFLSNARRFSPDGGAVTIAGRPAGDMVEVDISDHGVGMEAEALPKVFSKFYRAPRGGRSLGPGVGLGLALSHSIIEAHGGRVVAGSEGLGNGARFQFTLPVARPGAQPGQVLIIEDDAGFASLMKAEFAAQGIATLRAADAETAERLLLDMTPRAIIVDLVLPGIQGEDFLARIWAAGHTHLPVVVMTAKYLGPAEISALETAGAIAVLPKEAGAPQAAVALIASALALDPVAG